MRVTPNLPNNIRVLLVLVALLSWSSLSLAQDQLSAAQRLDDLKLQLIEVKAREETTKLRAQELDEALKPENIERSLAGVGSTRPEELREQRRRELTIHKTELNSELAQLQLHRSQLEAAIATTEAQAYQDSAAGFPEAQNELSGLSTRWIMIFSVAGVLAIGIFVLGYRKLRVSKQIGS
ncbi:MAG TPA: hypothetical protein VLB68_29925 [Pyrinomonadaceae bacterium]|nr:hypothetical protein [Pyrinomonadaceae bacterium]